MDEAADPFEYFFRLPWTDGLPVVTPTEARIAWMLGGTKRSPGGSLGHVPPAGHEATVEQAAIHAVMAGARPEYLPAILGTLEAVLAERFNLNGLQATMGPGGPMVMFNGPYARKIGVHGGSGCMGPGFRANAAIGRALRLMMLNLGGAIPGVSDMSCFGHPDKFSFCLSENEELSPWPPLSADLGFGPGEDVVTVFAAEGPHQAFDDSSSEPDGLLATIASVMSTMGSSNAYMRQNMVIAMSPDHAEVMRRAGYSRRDVKRRLFELARLPVGQMRRGGRFRQSGRVDWPAWVDRDDDACLVPMIHDPDDILLLVAGGRPGPHSMIVPGWNKSSRFVSIRYRTG